MSYTTDVYKSIIQDISVQDSIPGRNAYRKDEAFADGIAMVFAVQVSSMAREAYITIHELPSHIQFPRWRGISIDIAQIPAYGDEKYYVHFSQMPESTDYIFDIVIEDLRNAVKELSRIDECTGKIVELLTKWKRFFQSERPVVMSDELQEGLFGELTFLEKAISAFGTRAVVNWTGGERETHDFYFGMNAVEIKATAKKEPYTVHISSEYQMDDNDVPGRLFLYAVALRKSKTSGIRLPHIIAGLRELLQPDYSLKEKFDEKVFKYGYVDGVEDEYTTGFHVRDILSFRVQEGFPRITRSMYGKGISKVEYEIALGQCGAYECSETELLAELVRGGSND